MKYVIDAGNDYYEGREIRTFDLRRTVSNAVYNFIWGTTIGKYILKPIMRITREGGKKLECYT